MLTSKHNREYLQYSSFSFDRIKTDSTGIFLTIDKINEAISTGKKICFQYVVYLPTKEETLRHDGKWYIVSPQALLWNDDRYYAPSHSEEKKRSVPYYNIHSSKNQRFFTYFSGNI